MSERLAGKVVIVTGGGTGIGLGIVECCAQEGAAVVLAQRRVAIAETEAQKLRDQGYRALAVACDISQREQVQALVQTTVETFGRLDVMVNNAALTGAAAEGRSFLEETDAHWRKLIDVNLNGAFICTQEAAKQMVAQGEGGVIINISSVAQFAAQEFAAPYCASKAGLDGLNKVAAIELAPHNIRCMLVAPGDIYTEASADIVEKAQGSGATGKFFRFTPQDRRGSPAEVGAVVAFLASDAASFVTGTTWVVDGGFLSY